MPDPIPTEVPWYMRLEGLSSQPQGVTVMGSKPHLRTSEGVRGHWKLHLNINPDLADPTTKALLEWMANNRDLIEQAKIGKSSNQAGKGCTIYCGSYDDMMRVVDALEKMEAAGKIKLNGPGKDAVVDDMPVGKKGKLMARFDVSNEDALGLRRYGSQGLSYRTADVPPGAPPPDDAQRKEALKKSYALLERQYGEAFTGKKGPSGQPAWAEWIFDPNGKPPSVKVDPAPVNDVFKTSGYDFSKLPTRSPSANIPIELIRAAHHAHPAMNDAAVRANFDRLYTEALNYATADQQIWMRENPKPGIKALFVEAYLDARRNPDGKTYAPAAEKADVIRQRLMQFEAELFDAEKFEQRRNALIDRSKAPEYKSNPGTRAPTVAASLAAEPPIPERANAGERPIPYRAVITSDELLVELSKKPEIFSRVQGAAKHWETALFGDLHNPADQAEMRNVRKFGPADYDISRKNFKLLRASDLDPKNEAALLKEHKEFVEKTYTVEAVRESIKANAAEYMLMEAPAAFADHLAQQNPNNPVLAEWAKPENMEKLNNANLRSPDLAKFVEDVRNLPEFRGPGGTEKLFEMVRDFSVAKNQGLMWSRNVRFAIDDAVQKLEFNEIQRRSFISDGVIPYPANGKDPLTAEDTKLIIDEAKLETALEKAREAKLKAFPERVTEARSALLEYAKQRGTQNPYTPLMTDADARAAFEQMLEKVPLDSKARPLIELSLSNPDLRIVVIDDRVVSTHYSRPVSPTTEPAIVDINGFSRNNSNELYLRRYGENTTGTLMEEALHNGIKLVYQNHSLPWANDADPRKAILLESFRADLDNIGRDLSVMRRDLGLESYKGSEFSAEAVVKVMKMKARGAWTPELAERYKHLDRFVEEIIYKDVAEYGKTKTLPQVDPVQYRLTGYDGERLNRIPAFADTTPEGRRISIPVDGLNGLKEFKQIEETLRKLGVPQEVIGPDGKVEKPGYRIVEYPELKGKPGVVTAQFIELPAEVLKSNPAVSTLLEKSPNMTFIVPDEPVVTDPAKSGPAKPVPPLAPSAGKRIISMDGNVPGGLLALAVGLPGLVKNWDKMTTYDKGKGVALTGTGSAAIIAEPLKALTEGATTKGGKVVQTTGKILEKVGWVANPLLIVAGIDHFNAADQRKSDIAKTADKTQGVLLTTMGTHGTGATAVKAYNWLSASKAPPTPPVTGAPTVSPSTFKYAGRGGVMGAANLGLIAFTVADEGGHLLGREKFFDAIEKTHNAMDALRVSNDETMTVMRSGRGPTYVMDALPPVRSDYKQVNRAIEQLVKYKLATREEIATMSTPDLVKKFDQLQTHILSEANQLYKTEIEPRTVAGHIKDSLVNSEGIQAYTDATQRHNQLVQDSTMVGSAIEELGGIGVAMRGKSNRGWLPPGVKPFFEREQKFAKLKQDDPDLAAAIEKVAPVYRKLAMKQPLTDDEAKLLGDVIAERREKQMIEMAQKHADFVAGKPGGQKAEDYLAVQRKRAEAAGIEGTPLASWLLIRDAKDVELMVVSNNMAGARDIATKGDTAITRLDMREHFGLTPPSVVEITADQNLNNGRTSLVGVPGQGVMLQVLPESNQDPAMKQLTMRLVAQGFPVEELSSGGLRIPYDAVKVYLNPAAAKKLEAEMRLPTTNEMEAWVREGNNAIHHIEARRQQSGKPHPFDLGGATLEDHLKGNPNDPTVMAIVRVTADIEKEKARFAKAQEDYDKARGPEYEAALKTVKELKDATTPEDKARRNFAQQTVNSYKADFAVMQIAHSETMQNLYIQLTDTYKKLPTLAEAAPAVQALVKDRTKKARKPEDIAHFREMFEMDLKMLKKWAAEDGEKFVEGKIVKVKGALLTSTIANRRAAMDIDPYGSGAPATEEMMARFVKEYSSDRTDTPDAIKFAIKMFKMREGVRADSRDPMLVSTPTIPENIRERMKLAYPELDDKAIDAKLAELPPELQPPKPPAAAKPAVAPTPIGRIDDKVKDQVAQWVKTDPGAKQLAQLPFSTDTVRIPVIGSDTDKGPDKPGAGRNNSAGLA